MSWPWWAPPSSDGPALGPVGDDDRAEFRRRVAQHRAEEDAQPGPEPHEPVPPPHDEDDGARDEQATPARFDGPLRLRGRRHQHPGLTHHHDEGDDH